MTQLQANRLARRASLTLIRQGHTVDLDGVKRIVNRSLVRLAKSNNGGNPQTTSEQAAEMAKDILLSMSDKLSYPDNYGYYFQKLFNQIYKDLAFDDKKVAKEPKVNER